MNNFESLAGEPTPVNDTGDLIYSLDAVRNGATAVHSCDKNSWLAIWEDPDKESILVEYALFEFHMSESDGSSIMVDCTFHGYGLAGSLREMRHTYFPNDGYVFYLPMARMRKAFDILERYFDAE